MTKHAAEFFAFARERHSIHLRRKAGQAWPWTADPVLLKYSFTNVFRELDRTTVWWREVSDTMRDKPEVLLATVLFRWFNRITTGEAIFKQLDFVSYKSGNVKTAWTRFLGDRDAQKLKGVIKSYCGKGPYVTGSYIILGQQGMPKLDGVLACIEQFTTGEYPFKVHAINFKHDGADFDEATWQEIAAFCLKYRGNVKLEDMWNYLRHVPYLGDFMAYEVVTDLRWTALLDKAPDIMTWANPGPGAARGLARVHGRSIAGRKIQKPPKAQLVQEMRELLALSKNPSYWPQRKGTSWVTGGPHGSFSLSGVKNGKMTEPYMAAPGAWPALEMRDIEHTLCEFDKYQRVITGEGRPRGTYKPA